MSVHPTTTTLRTPNHHLQLPLPAGEVSGSPSIQGRAQRHSIPCACGVGACARPPFATRWGSGVRGEEEDRGTYARIVYSLVQAGPAVGGWRASEGNHASRRDVGLPHGSCVGPVRMTKSPSQCIPAEIRGPLQDTVRILRIRLEYSILRNTHRIHQDTLRIQSHRKHTQIS